MKNTLLIGILFLLSILILGGCEVIGPVTASPVVNGRITIQNLEMKPSQITNLTFNFYYKLTPDKPTDFKINFITGNYLTIYKNNSIITEDIVRNVSGDIQLNYEVRSSIYIPNEQVVESVTILATPTGSTLAYKFISDFVLIKR